VLTIGIARSGIVVSRHLSLLAFLFLVQLQNRL
jgi:hypothetical protein